MYLNLTSYVYTGALMEQSHNEGVSYRCGDGWWWPYTGQWSKEEGNTRDSSDVNT